MYIPVDFSYRSLFFRFPFFLGVKLLGTIYLVVGVGNFADVVQRILIAVRPKRICVPCNIKPSADLFRIRVLMDPQ
jgi:hypothetical protein